MTHDSKKDCDRHDLNEITYQTFHHSVGERLHRTGFHGVLRLPRTKVQLQAGTESLVDGPTKGLRIAWPVRQGETIGRLTVIFDQQGGRPNAASRGIGHVRP